MNTRQAIEDADVFCDVSVSSRQKLSAVALSQRFTRGEFLFRAKEDVESLYLLTSGYVVLEQTNLQSDRRSIFILGPGQLLNETVLERPKSSISCYALTATEVVSVHRKQFLDLMEQDFALTKAVFCSLSSKMRRLYRQIGNSTKMMTLDIQVSSKIWKMTKDFGVKTEDGIELPFPITITFLASLVGSNRETVSRIVKKLSEEEILSIRNGKCTVSDLNALKNYMFCQDS